MRLATCFALSGHGGRSQIAEEHLQDGAANRLGRLSLLLLGFSSNSATWSVSGLGGGWGSPLRKARKMALSMQDREPLGDPSGSPLDDQGNGGSGDEGNGNRQVLRFRDAKTGIPVVLVGTMHFNPASIDLAENVVRQEGMADAGVVLMELCPTRWNRTAAKLRQGQLRQGVQPEKEFNLKSIKRWLFRDEFQAAFDMAVKCGISDIELADQEYEETMERLGYLFRLTAKQVLSGPKGWLKIGNDVRRGYDELTPTSGGNGFTYLRLFDPFLLAGLPVVLIRGLAANKKFLTALACVLFVLDMGIDYYVPDNPDTLIEEVGQDAVVGAFALLLARVLLVAIIAERNSVLAGNIRSACERASAHGKATVIAVLGMAHLNGVYKMLGSGSDELT